MHQLPGVNSLFENPTKVEDSQDKSRNPLQSPTSVGWGRDAVRERIVSSSADICLVCNRVGGIEYTDELGNRVFFPDDAYRKVCLVCSSKWENHEEGWTISRPPDEIALNEVVGKS